MMLVVKKLLPEVKLPVVRHIITAIKTVCKYVLLPGRQFGK